MPIGALLDMHRRRTRGRKKWQRMATVTVRRAEVRGQVRWCVDRVEGGKRKRSFHSSKAAAEAEAAQLRQQVRTSGEAWISIPPRERDALIAVWMEAKSAGLDLGELVRRAKSDPTAASQSVSISRAIDSLVESRREGSRADRYTDELKDVLQRFAKGREELPIGSVSADDLRAWLKNPAWSGWTRHTYRRRLATLFRYAVDHGWVPSNPMKRVPVNRIVAGPPPIFTVEQHGICLRWLSEHPRLLAWYALSCMAGLRPEEAQATQWSMINLREGWIRVEAQTSKKRHRRVVYPRPEALAWLTRARELRSQLPITWEPRKDAQAVLKPLLGLDRWPQDITRHTAASYWIAVEPDLPRLAHAMGTSIDELKTKYLALVTKEDAARFWSITP
jgi:integrase